MDKLFLHTADCTAATLLEKIAGLSEGLKIKGAISKESKPIHSKEFVLIKVNIEKSRGGRFLWNRN